MPIVNPVEMIKDAQKQKYAVPAFNVHNLETVQAVVMGAEKLKSPIIISTTPGTIRHAGIEFISEIVKIAAKKSNIPIALHVDHCQSYELLEQCIKHGYTSLMIDASMLAYEDNVKLTREVVKLGHSADACVEAELGKIGGVEDDLYVSQKASEYTDVIQAQDFVTKAQPDTLAIAIGTAHGIYKGEPKLDYNRLYEIREALDTPLVLHGASGVPKKSVRKAILLGISKVNIATELKIPFTKAIKEVFRINPEENDPRAYMGAGRDAAQAIVEKKILMCMSNGKFI